MKSQKQLMLESEVQVMMNSDSPNIVKCYDLLDSESLRVVVIEYCPEGTLKDQITKEGRINEPQAIRILSQLMMGFAVEVFLLRFCTR